MIVKRAFQTPQKPAPVLFLTIRSAVEKEAGKFVVRINKKKYKVGRHRGRHGPHQGEEVRSCASGATPCGSGSCRPTPTAFDRVEDPAAPHHRRRAAADDRPRPGSSQGVAPAAVGLRPGTGFASVGAWSDAYP